MSDETVQVIGAVIVALAQIYVLDPSWSFTLLFARFWDWLARVTGELANFLGWFSMHARANYYMAVNAYGS